jgi:hypothetical protein
MASLPIRLRPYGEGSRHPVATATTPRLWRNEHRWPPGAVVLLPNQNRAAGPPQQLNKDWFRARQTFAATAPDPGYVESTTFCRSMDRAPVFAAVLAAAAGLSLFAAPARAATMAPCPETAQLKAPCERPLPPCTPAEAPCQR